MAIRTVSALSAVLVALFAPNVAAQGNFKRINPSECGTEEVNFVDYASKTFGQAISCTATECDYKEVAASTFSIKYRPNYKILTFSESGETEATLAGKKNGVASATYILYQCGKAKPNDEFTKGIKGTVQYVPVPVTAAVTGDSSVGWQLAELEVEDRLRYVGQETTAPCLMKLSASKDKGGCGKQFIGEFDTGTKTKQTEYQVEFGFAGNVTLKQIYFQASADPDPIGRAEKIIYLSTFFNKEAKGLEYFSGVQKRYSEAKVVAGGNASTVAWISASSVDFYGYTNADGKDLEGEGVTISFARYKAVYTENAGGKLANKTLIEKLNGAATNKDDIIFASSEYASMADMQKVVAEALKNVDVLIDESFHAEPKNASLAGLLDKLGLGNDTADDYPFIANDAVWRHDKAQTTTGKDDWFGEGLARPDLVLGDLKAVIAKDSNMNKKFFRNLAVGEGVSATGPDACDDLDCTSYDQQKAITIDMGSMASTSNSTSSNTPPASSAPVQNDAALGIMAQGLTCCLISAVFVALVH